MFKTSSAAKTKKLARLLARESLKTKTPGALVFALEGNLGSGKTTFVQGFMKGAGIKKRIISPTFVLIKNYELRIKNYGNHKQIYHIDCYRIKKTKELPDLGLKEILKNPQNVVLIEWPEIAKKYLPKNAIWIRFDYGKKDNERIIKISPYKA